MKRQTWKYDPNSAENMLLGLGYLFVLTGCAVSIGAVVAKAAGCNLGGCTIFMGIGLGGILTGLVNANVALWLKSPLFRRRTLATK